MSTSANHYIKKVMNGYAVISSFVFCSEKCMATFDKLYKTSSESEKIELCRKEIII